MYYPLYNNPFYYPNRAYIPNMCSYNHAYENINNRNNFNYTSFANANSEEKNNNRNIVIEGVIYAPSSSKRDMMHELEAIIQSVEFN